MNSRRNGLQLWVAGLVLASSCATNVTSSSSVSQLAVIQMSVRDFVCLSRATCGEDWCGLNRSANGSSLSVRALGSVTRLSEDGKIQRTASPSEYAILGEGGELVASYREVTAIRFQNGQELKNRAEFDNSGRFYAVQNDKNTCSVFRIGQTTNTVLISIVRGRVIGIYSGNMSLVLALDSESHTRVEFRQYLIDGTNAVYRRSAWLPKRFCYRVEDIDADGWRVLAGAEGKLFPPVYLIELEDGRKAFIGRDIHVALFVSSSLKRVIEREIRWGGSKGGLADETAAGSSVDKQ
jgi:hypothetical protein